MIDKFYDGQAIQWNNARWLVMQEGHKAKESFNYYKIDKFYDGLAIQMIKQDGL
jgi:hypothetical protein